jgi:hypothetical protein
MGTSHLRSNSLDYKGFAFDPIVYARAWPISILAIFAAASRYLRMQMQPILPWMSAAVVALLIHLIHRPFWNYYAVHLVIPLAVLAGVGLVDLCRALSESQISSLERKFLTFAGALTVAFWVWNQGERAVTTYQTSTVITSSPVTKELRSLGAAGGTMFSINPIWTFTAQQVQTPTELTIVPLKRAWSGQINDEIMTAMLGSNNVDALVLNQAVLNQPVWTNLLSKYAPTAREGATILFVHKRLATNVLDNAAISETTVDLRVLGL